MAIKIGFDAKRAFNNHSGLGVYSRELISAVQRLLPESMLILFSPKIKKDIFSITENSRLRIENSSLGFLWRSCLIYFDIKKSNLNVYHGLAGELPFWIPKGVKKIVTIHDVLFERFPDDYPWIDRKIYAWKAKYACKTADRIIAVSEATKRDLIDFYQINESKIKVISVGINFNVKLDTKRPYPRNYMVCISSFLPRKNQSLLIDSFQMVVEKMDTP